MLQSWQEHGMGITVLAPEVANQIAAGEVVERPSSVVKELVENSIDAGGTEIRVEIREGGRRLIRVEDNGSGISLADAPLVFRRHATSKIRQAADLNCIKSLGFRGEALASIASVAQVTLSSCIADQQAGFVVRVDGGVEHSPVPQGMPVGTVLKVEHLFANVPARAKFLKQAVTESGHIYQIITRYALAYPERRLSLVSDGKLLFQSTGSGDRLDVLVKMYGSEMARDMIPLDDVPADGEVPGRVTISGYTGAANLHRSNRTYVSLFVNRRWFQDSSLSYAIAQAYHTFLPTGRYPVTAAFIELDPQDVDVNVHPTKAEVRFADAHRVYSVLQRAVRRAVTERSPIPEYGLPAPQVPADTGVSGEYVAPAGWWERRSVLLGAGGHSISPADAAPGISDTPREAAPQQAPGFWPRLPVLRVVGQVSSTYIVAEGPDGLYLIDQHAAHERVLYEQLLAENTHAAIAVQPLLEPVLLTFAPPQAIALAAALVELAQVGVEMEAFGGQSFLLRTLPTVLSKEDPQAALTEIADALSTGDDHVARTHEARLVTLICKRAAVKGGQVLSMPEMQALVGKLEQCQSPRTCPHGRPTMVTLTADELARQFGRLGY
jgi:DNA mismatch repair protein MutL